MPLKNYDIVHSIDELAALTRRVIDAGQPFALDIETGYRGPDVEKGSLKIESNLLVGISFTNSTDWARYAPLAHDHDESLDNYQAARLLWPMLQTGLGVAHNAAFELRNLSRWFREQLSDDPDFGEAVRACRGYFPIRSDTQIEAYLVAAYEKFGLKFLTQAIFGHTMTELAELFVDLPKNRHKFLRFNTLPLGRKAIEYACEDSVWCLAIHQRYHPQVRDMLLYKVEIQLLYVVCDMEDNGLRFDWEMLRHAADELAAFQSRFNAEIMAELSELCGEPIAINLGSPAKVSEVLYEKLGMVTTVYTAKTKDLPRAERKMSTGKIALAGLAKRHPVVKKILQWKEQNKLLGTYLSKYEDKYGGAPDGMVHANYLSAVVITGRFACSEPNVQNLPKTYHYDLIEAADIHQRHADDHGKGCDCAEPRYQPPPGTCFRLNFRDAVVAPADHYILGFDLSQAELRAIAGEAREQALLAAFDNDEDVHRLTASLLLGVPFDEVTKDQRDMGKTFNFALLYGMGVKSLADRLGIPVDEAQKLYDQYFVAYSGIAAWSDRQVQLGKAQGFVTSKFGRRLPIWEFKSDKRWIYQKGERACVNYPIQGCLPSDTRVLTRAGWLPIGQFEDGAEVWTGAEWATAVRLEMGVAPRVRLHLSDGRTFDCDNRHKLLVKGDPWPEWKLVTEAKGLPLCQDQNTDWGEPDGSTVEDWYWVGRFVGDGSLRRSTQGHVRWSVAFDGVKEADDIERFKTWLGDRFKGGTNSRLGYCVDDGPLRRGTGKGVSVIGGTKSGVAFWLAHGIEVGARSKTLRIPEQVFRLDRARREAFCEGYLAADGNSRHKGRETYWSKLTSASRAGLEDMLRLFQTVGRTGRIGKPVVLKGRGAGGTDHVFYDLWLQRAPKELTIVDIEYMDEEPMYTLSVDHPRHAFSSEGLISKNSATGDLMKIIMVKASKALRQAGLSDRVKLVMNVHDALEFYVHRSVGLQEAIDVLRPAVVFPVPGWPSMKADWHIAKRWGSPRALEWDAHGQARIAGDKTYEAAPEVVEDEETGEEEVVIPDELAEAVRRVVSPAEPSGQPRTVIVVIDDMPALDSYLKFRELVDALPGQDSLVLRTPEGELPLPGTTSLSPAHLAQVSMCLGPTKIIYAGSDVDAAAFMEGIAL